MPKRRRNNRSLLSKRKGAKDGTFKLRGTAQAITASEELIPENTIDPEDDESEDKDSPIAGRLRSSNSTPAALRNRDVQFLLRVAIFYVYVEVLNAPDKNAWLGPGGTCRKIMEILKIEEGRRAIVKRVLRLAHAKAKMGQVYAGERAERREFTNYMLRSSSEEMQVIADAMESGFGLRLTKELLNEHRRQNQLEVVGLTTVWMAYLRLKPIISPVKKRKQGSNDPTSPWAKARFEYVTQILVRFGEKVLVDDIKAPDGSIPDKFDLAKLTKVSINQVAFWDETHKKVRVGQVTANGMDYQVRFRRDESGKLDIENGTYISKEGTQLKMKYAEEVRLCLGVVKVKLDDGTHVGKRLPVFDYSGKVILSIKDYAKQIAEEIQRVRNLQGNGGGWVESSRLAGQLWESESITLVKGVGPKTAERLAENGVVSIGDLKQCNNQQLVNLAASGLSIKMLTRLQLLVEGTAVGEPPADAVPFDHKKEINPYLSRYGPGNWLDKLSNSTFVNKYVSISTLVMHIYTHTKACFAGTQFAENFYFYHDALSLMTATETVVWMKEQDIHKHWLLPELDLNKGTCYEGRPVGNSPELMPLDASLNKDVDDAVHRHIVWTNRMAEDDPEKFSMETPKKGSFAYRRVWNCPVVPGVATGETSPDGALTSARICQDIDKFLTSALTIFQHKGIVVEGLGTRHGHRSEVGISKARGGARKKGIDEATLANTHFVHSDAKNARDSLVLDSLHRHQGEEAPYLDLEEIPPRVDDLPWVDELDDDFEADEEGDNVEQEINSDEDGCSDDSD
jgi:hypothetical protein